VSESAPSFGVLGALEVRRGGEPVRLPRGRRRAVLAVLLARAGQPVPADTLIDAAWRDELPADPESALHTVVSRLRAVLGDDVLRTGPAGYVIVPQPGALDADRFEALRAQAAAAGGARAVTLLDEALGLWRGPAYAEFADRDFARPEAVRLDELRLVTVEDAAERCLQLGAVDRAVTSLEALIAGHPLRERARGLLMTALYHAGQPARALEQYRCYRELLVSELGLDPSPALRDLQRRILGHRMAAVPRPAPAAPAWLTTSTAYVGREDDAGALLDSVTAHRLVTVTGAGGVGKTRLVAEALGSLSERLGLPVTVIELAAIRAGQADTTVAAALGLGAATAVRAAVTEYLSISAGLLVFDNCEHVLDDVCPLVEEILRCCPGIRVLATSRRRLGLAGEQALPLGPLPVPDPDVPERAAMTAAVRLFTDRVRRVRPSFVLTEETLGTVADISRRLDGLPLALELAAMRAATLGLAAVLDRLDRSLDLLGEDGQLRAVIDWSFRLLAPAERQLLSVLSVFSAGFDLETAEQVAGPVVEGSVPLALARLTDSSLVAASQDGSRTGYRLLMIVRAFAAEQLAGAGREPTARLAHARWIASVAEHAARQATGPGCGAAVAEVIRLRADVAAAVRWSLDCGHPGLAARITGNLRLCTHWRPDASLLDLSVEVARHAGARESPAAALAMAAGGMAACDTGALEEAVRLGAEALRRAAGADDRFLALLCLGIATLYRGEHGRSATIWQQIAADTTLPAARRADGYASLALLCCYAGDLPAAREHAASARTAAQLTGASGCQAFTTYAAGEVALPDNPEEGVQLLRAAVSQAEATRASQVITVARIALASALTRLGRNSEAVALFPPLLDQAYRDGNWPQLWTALRILAELLVSLDRHETAAVLLAAARQSPSAPALSGPDIDRYRQLEELISQRTGTRVLGQITDLARALPRAQVVDRARAALVLLSRPPAPAAT
jgi:predicted ATPase/DNA-binding SARP family transcriptional activator